MQSKILIVEEQSKTTDKISAQLEENGYWTDICHRYPMNYFPCLRRVHMFS